MPESSPNTARSTGAQATDRLYTADEVRQLMARSWEAGFECGQFVHDEYAGTGGYYLPAARRRPRPCLTGATLS
jgi:hypothetical protein